MRSGNQVDTSPEGWVARFLAADDEGRLRIARMVLDHSAEAALCFEANHQRAIDRLTTERDAFHDAVVRVGELADLWSVVTSAQIYVTDAGRAITDLLPERAA